MFEQLIVAVVVIAGLLILLWVASNALKLDLFPDLAKGFKEGTTGIQESIGNVLGVDLSKIFARKRYVSPITPEWRTGMAEMLGETRVSIARIGEITERIKALPEPGTEEWWKLYGVKRVKGEEPPFTFSERGLEPVEHEERMGVLVYGGRI